MYTQINLAQIIMFLFSSKWSKMRVPTLARLAGRRISMQSVREDILTPSIKGGKALTLPVIIYLKLEDAYPCKAYGKLLLI